MEQYGTSYKRGTLFFPKALRKKVYILYAFVRVADQLVDTPWVDKKSALKELTTMLHETEKAWQWTSIHDELITAFVSLAHEHNFERERIEAFFAAMRLDTEKSIYATYEELQIYMYGSAEVIWLMMTELIGYEGDKHIVYSLAKQLGEAMQYTNFLRDIAEDRTDHKRIYIPLERLALYGLTYDDIKLFIEQKHGNEHWASFCKQEVKVTQQLYLDALGGVSFLDRQWRFAVRVAALLYAGILWKIERHGYDQFAHDVHTTKREKFRFFLGAWKTYEK